MEDKYKEALERARKYKEENYDMAYSVDKVIDEIFPELAESEDELIREEIISALRFANYDGVYDKHIAYLEKQKEQKPAEWSKEDKVKLDNCCAVIAQQETYFDTTFRQKCLDFLCELPKRFSLPKKQEWSEEDEKMRNEIITIMNGGKVTSGTYLSEYAAWLKSLRPSWKPSEEQMYSLGTVVKGSGECSVGSVGYNLQTLYIDLIKLRED